MKHSKAGRADRHQLPRSSPTSIRKPVNSPITSVSFLTDQLSAFTFKSDTTNEELIFPSSSSVEDVGSPPLFVFDLPTKPKPSPFQYETPQEILELIFQGFHPKQVMKYRPLCRSINATLMDPHFAFLNLSHFLKETSTQTIAKRRRRGAKSTDFESVRFSLVPRTRAEDTVKDYYNNDTFTEFDALWFRLPKSYQVVYANSELYALERMTFDGAIVGYRGGVMGRIPKSIGLLTCLVSLVLTGGILVGTLPKEIGKLILLQVLDLHGNPGLCGTVPEEFRCLVRLNTLDLRKCGLSGRIPVAVMELPELHEVHFTEEKAIV